MKLSRIKQLLAEYKDENGFIGHKHPDWGFEFGDGTQRLGTVWVANFVLYKEATIAKAELFADQLDSILLHTVDKRGKSKLQYLRHWDKKYWPGQPWIMSRDNFEPIWTAAQLLAPHNERIEKHAKLMTKLVTKRGGFLWNYKHIWPQEQFEPKMPDAWLPWDTAAKNIRAKGAWYLWPLLVIFDFDTLFNSLIRVYVSIKDMHDTTSDHNHQLRIIYKQQRYWTPTIWLAKMIYRFRRVAGIKVPPGETPTRISLTGKNAGALSAVVVYYHGDRNPPIDLVWKPVIDKYL